MSGVAPEEPSAEPIYWPPSSKTRHREAMLSILDGLHRNGYTEEEVAIRADLSLKLLSKILRGDTIPKLERMLRVAAALGLRPQDFVDGRFKPPERILAHRREPPGQR